MQTEKLDPQVIQLPKVEIEVTFPEQEAKAAELYEKLLADKKLRSLLTEAYDPLSLQTDYFFSQSRDVLGAIKAFVSVVLEMKLFELNDRLTRKEVTDLIVDFISKQSVPDYVVICDETNNTPALIDLGELHVDVALKLTEDDDFSYLSARSYRG